jgi:hypothetical protein
VLIVEDDALADRRDAVRAGGPLAALFDSLAGELSPWLSAIPPIPTEKALLSRVGGRCGSCGVALEFDPASPHRHRCASCGRMHEGTLHDRAWIMPYQLWLAERALQGALFHLLRGSTAHAKFARDVVGAYAERYLAYPNQDNVLGPTRLFFSTYLESIWLLQMCFAADFLAASGDHAIADIAREKIVEPGSAIIAGYDEGLSNRQVWNNAALIAASLLLGRDRDVDALAHGPSGVEAHLSRALLADGTWYEGENYHQFALRGLWYCVTMLEVAGATIRDDLRERFQRAFAAPFVTALPDFTMPSRKDSQYAVSLRQWRIAELTELGFARRQEPTLGGALLRLYGDDIERHDSGRSRSTADVERNAPPSALTRADLGWRALLHAVPTLPRLPRVEPRSAILESQGYAVFRREGGIYVGFEFGQSGGGHGHPDRLNLTLHQNATRWLDDMGTGSYVDPSLHWYRSTLAHNAPLVNGKSQPIRDGTLLAYDEREGLGWIVAELTIPEEGVRLERAIVVAPDYLIDELRWEGSGDIRVELPWHLPLPPYEPVEAAAIDGGRRPEDGFQYLEEPRTVRGPHLPSLFTVGDTPLRVLPEPGPEKRRLFLAKVPGQPAAQRRTLALMRVNAARGAIRSIVIWNPKVSIEGEVIWCGDDEAHTHRRDQHGWHVELRSGHAKSSVDLAGFREPPPKSAPESGPRRVPLRLHRTTIVESWLSDIRDRGSWLVYELGEPHYRRSEVTWRDARSPATTIAIAADGKRVVVLADVRAGDAIFAAANAENPYDNEHADTMRAGVQLYLDANGWMLVPEEGDDRVRARPLSGEASILNEAAWRRTAHGYEMRIVLAPRADSFSMDVVVNETVSGRERRRGQLVMSGARGEFVYLRGDRHDAARLIPMVVVP